MPDQPTPEDTLLSAKEVARRLDITIEAARKRMQRGSLPTRRLGRLLRVRASELQAYIDNLPRKTP